MIRGRIIGAAMRTAAAALFVWCISIDAMAQQAGLADYAQALRQLTTGEYEQASASFERALKADDEIADRHVGRAIALLLNRQGQAAKPHLDRALRLQARHPAARVWHYFYDWAYAPRGRSIPEVPHDAPEPYAHDLINATTEYWGARERNQPDGMAAAWKKVEQCAAAWAWRQLAAPELVQAQFDDIKGMYERKEYASCLAITERLLETNPADARLWSIAGGCRLALKDYHGARLDYTRGLSVSPVSAAMLLGRSIAAANTGGLRTAREDAALAARINPDLAARYKAELDGAMAQATGRVSTAPGAEVLAKLTTDAASKPMDALLPIADGLVRADAAERLVAAEARTREMGRLQWEFDRDPRNVEKAVALAAFCIRPTVETPAKAGGKAGMARVRVGEPDLDRARTALDAAGQLDRTHHGALTQQALWMRAKGAKDRMIQTVAYAFEQGALNYDLAMMHLDYYQEQAASLEGEAAALRSPRVHYENRSDGRYQVTTYPSQADLARAAQLEAQAREHRRVSMQPLQRLAAAHPDTAIGKLAQAEVERMIGEYDRMLATAEAALAIDPWHLESREFIIEHAPRVGLNDIALKHLDIMENLYGPSARVTIGPAPTLMNETRYTSAVKLLEQGQQVEPSSGRAAALRAIALTLADRKDEAETVFRVASAIERARLAMLAPHESTPLQADAAALAMAIQSAWSAMLQGTDAPGAWSQLESLLAIASRVPRSQWDRELPATNVPTVYAHSDDRRRVGMTTRELVIAAQMNGAKLLAAQDRLEDAARLLVACRADHESSGRMPPVDAAAYPIIRKMGEERAARVFPPIMMEGYRMMSRMGGNPNNSSRGTETLGKEGDRLQWLRARLVEIDTDLELLRQSQTMTAMRKREELMNERREVEAEIAELTRRRRGG